MPIAKRMIFILITGIMFLGMLTFSTGKPVKSAVIIKPATSSTTDDNTTVSNDPKKEEPSPTPVEDDPLITDEVVTPTAKPTPDPDAPNPLRLEIYPDVHDVVQAYFDAKTTGDISTLKTLVTDPIYISAETITAQSEYIKGYSDIKCYTKRGGGDIDLVVYCTFNTTITTIDTPIASLESFYIVYQDGKPMIFSGIFNEKTQNYLSKLDNDEDVLELKASVYEEINNALDSDPALKEFWDKLLTAVETEDQTDDSSPEENSETN